MTEPTYTEAEIREAIDRTNNIGDWTADKIFKELKRPKHDFAEGQVVFDSRYACYTIIPDVDSQCRHLNMTELGPHVKALRESMESLPPADWSINSGIAVAAIQAFDKAVGESDE